ncbi:glycosyltransferase family 2 protein [Candidatus Palauibacter sp.]|uniref:glycosyltransferase family 2 protein n=1 Tax=Candidatus Palauibacter sp. TaxID=3101350 RepID=UPI003C70295D
MRTAILIPARDEADALPHLFEALGAERVRQVVLVDNGSRDATADIARAAGSRVVYEPRAGYGRACLAGIESLRPAPPDALVFLDADDFAAAGQFDVLLRPIEEGEADLVIGEREADAGGGVRWHARLGNRLVLAAMRRLYGADIRDMGPFRAIRWSTLESLKLDDTNYGWYVQMQVRALRARTRVRGAPVRFERRTMGRSKVSGSLPASIRAGWVMLRTLVVEVARRDPVGAGTVSRRQR